MNEFEIRKRNILMKHNQCSQPISCSFHQTPGMSRGLQCGSVALRIDRDVCNLAFDLLEYQGYLHRWSDNSSLATNHM